jgi:4-amino-4-deoxy-L-arabinose transferase-like glycosyltransferase
MTTKRTVDVERRFAPLLGAAVVLAAAVRFAYLLTDDRAVVGGDGFAYHVVGLRLADGLGYTYGVGGPTVPFAHHPPGWVTILGAVSWLGGRSQLAHQLVGMFIGLGVVAVIGLVGRRYFDARVGLVAAGLAALYPGFWVLEGSILSEPLDLLVLGVLTLVVADLRDRPTLARSLGVGALCGLLTLVRSEGLALMVILVAPVLLAAKSLPLRTRATRLGAAGLVCIVLIAPWAIYTSSRFSEPVLLSINGGYTLLSSNCPPATYNGERVGFYDQSCYNRLLLGEPNLDLAQVDARARDEAIDNIEDHWTELPAVVPVRLGRMLGVFRPAQTVGFVAEWLATPDWPVWAWVASFWVLLPFAVGGIVVARRTRRFLLPLLAPGVIALGFAITAYGEPRFHTPADLGIVVLAAAGMVRLVGGRAATDAQAGTRSDR